MRIISVILSLITVSLISFLLYNKMGFLNVIVKFDNLEPFERQVPVYYKGFKIGKSVKIYPDKHYKNTYLRLKLSPANVELPNNINAKLERNLSREYINLVPPSEASVELLKEGDVINGIPAKDITTALSDKIDNIDSIINNTSSVLDQANKTLKELEIVFKQVNGIISEVKGDIKTSTSNIAKTTSNVQKVSANMSNSLSEETLKSSSNNIESTTQNLKEISENLNSVSVQIDKTSMPIVNSTLCQTYSTVKHTNEITGGVKHTLKKHGGFGRVIFGRPISKNCK